MQKTRYSAVAVALHWLIAIGIFINMKYALSFDALEHGDKQALRAAIGVHKSIGITVLGLVLMRLIWRRTHTPPPLPEGTKPGDAKLSTGIHHLLYLLMFVVPVLGWLHESAFKLADKLPFKLYGTVPFFHLSVFGGLDPATRESLHGALGNVHGLLSWVMMAAVGLHVAGALKHSLIEKQPSLSRMWFGK